MNEIQATQADRLRQLHGEIIGAARMLLDKAIEAGKILRDVKAYLAHGEFTTWVETNAGFNIRTAQRYMKIYENREQLKNDSVSLLTDAHKMLTAPKEEQKIRINGLPLDEVLRIAALDERQKKLNEKIIALQQEWDLLKDSNSISEVADFYYRAKDAHSEATAFTIDAEMNLGRVLNELKKLFPMKEDAKEVLSFCKLIDGCIEDGLTAEDIRQCGGEDYQVEFYEEYKAMGMSHKWAAETLSLVQ